MPSPPKAVVAQRRRRPKGAAPTGDSGTQYHLRGISRALDVLECFDDARPERTLKEICDDLGLPEASLFRILQTLQSREYLVQNPDGAYTLAPKILLGRL
jgi:hypothetical protein